MSCPQTMILQCQQKLQLLRRRAWDKSPIALSRLNTCNRVKTTNPEYKNTQQGLTGWKFSFPTLQGYASCQGYIGGDLQAFIQLYQGRWGSVKAISSYSLLLSESLLSDF